MNLDALREPGKAAMCTKIGAAKSELHGSVFTYLYRVIYKKSYGVTQIIYCCTWLTATRSYGDIEAGIKSVELVDVPPGMVLRANRDGDNEEIMNRFGFGEVGPVGSSFVGGKPDVQPQTEIVHYNTLGADHLAIKMFASALNYPDLLMPSHVYQTRPGESGAAVP